MSTTNDKNGSDLDPMSLEAIEAELKKFEIEERKRLGLPVETAQAVVRRGAARVHARPARAHDDPRRPA